MEKRERLHIQEEHLKQQLHDTNHMLKESNYLMIEGLPENYNQLMLTELVRGFPGLEDYALLDQEVTYLK